MTMKDLQTKLMLVLQHVPTLFSFMLHTLLFLLFYYLFHIKQLITVIHILFIFVFNFTLLLKFLCLFFEIRFSRRLLCSTFMNLIKYIQCLQIFIFNRLLRHVTFFKIALIISHTK